MDTQKIENLANFIISDLKKAGFTPDEMIETLHLARKKIELKRNATSAMDFWEFMVQDEEIRENIRQSLIKHNPLKQKS